MDNYNITFTGNNAAFHVLSKAALPEDVADELLKHDRIGKNQDDKKKTGNFQIAARCNLKESRC